MSFVQQCETADVLPAEFASWKAFAQHLQGRLADSESQRKISDLRCAKLERKVADLIHRVYGAKSEKLNPAQRLLFGILEGQEALLQPALMAQRQASGKSTNAPRKGGGRRPIPDNLPVRRRILDLPPEQTKGLVVIRHEITRQIEYRPSLFYQLEIVRPVYASPDRTHAPMVRALPPQVIPQAGVGPGFITHVLVSKYVDHLPLYRQESIDARGGVWVSRQRRARYVRDAAHLLITVRELLKERVLRSRYVQVDETFTKLLDPDRRGRSHTAYLWGYHAPHEKAVVLEFSPSRSGSILHDFFPPEWDGIVQTDGAHMYPGAFKHRPDIVHFECMMHLRRRVTDALRANELEAVPLLREITRSISSNVVPIVSGLRTCSAATSAMRMRSRS